MPKARKTGNRIESSETTNTALLILLKDLDILTEWAEADADASREAGAMQQASEDTTRAHTYRRCHDQLANAFKDGIDG